MAITILDGKKLADEILANVYKEVKTLKKKPGLAVILIGDNPASKLYISLKEKAAKKVDINFHTYYFDNNDKEDDIIKTIEFLNSDDEIDAILVQLPLDPKFNTDKIIKTIAVEKDVDGFHPQNKENYLESKKVYIIPGLNLAILYLLESLGENLNDKKVTIIANNLDSFAKSLKKTLEDEKMQVQISTWDNYIKNKELQKADIIVIAIGKKEALKADLVKKDAIIIDVGINKEKNKVYGDADFNSLKDKVKAISPVPGGVGPMTVALLLENTLNLALRSKKK